MNNATSEEFYVDVKQVGTLPVPEFCHVGELSLAVYCQGDPSKPNIVLVHGYPDNSSVWNLLADQLANEFYIIRYDVRGAGNSTPPADRSGYLLAHLQADLEAVAAQFCTHPKFHLVGHDWGSVQSWESVSCPRFQGKILSYTSISGPCLDHVGHWFRRRWRKRGGSLAIINQVFRSWYIWFFHIPLLAPLLWRVALGRSWPRLMRMVESISTGSEGVQDSAQRWRDGVNGIELYRANCLRRFRHPRQRFSTLAVQLVIPLQDRFLSADLYSEISEWVPNLTVCHVGGGHWLPLSHSTELTMLIAGFVNQSAP